MKFVTISDTHGLHNQLLVPEADAVIHAGDICMEGRSDEVLSFLNWFSNLPHRYKVFIAGNHDFYFERTPIEEIKKVVPESVFYLEDSEIELEGIKIWGSPIQPWFFDWAFNRHRGIEIQKHWDLIPNDTDVLVTHGPVKGILDRNYRGDHVGCDDLLKKVMEIKPKVHICGHIHEPYGSKEREGIKFINASYVNLQYKPVNEPMTFKL